MKQEHTQEIELSFLEAPIAMVITRYRIITTYNKLFAKMFDCSTEDMVGRSISMLYPSYSDFVRIGTEGHRQMQDGKIYHNERIMKRGGSDEFWCRVWGHSLSGIDPFALAVWCFVEIEDREPSGIQDLTRRQKQITFFICKGMTSKQIAGHLGLSARTVEAHRTRIMKKVGVRNLAELIARVSGLPTGNLK